MKRKMRPYKEYKIHRVRVWVKKLAQEYLGESEILRNLSNGCMATEPTRKHEHNVEKDRLKDRSLTLEKI